MSNGHLRFAAWFEWTGRTQASIAADLGCSAVFVGYLVRGERAPGLELAHAVERLTVEPRGDGATWPGGPIRTEEWIAAATPTASGR